MGPLGSLPAGPHPTGDGFQVGNGDMQQVLMVGQWLLWDTALGGPRAVMVQHSPGVTHLYPPNSLVPPKLTCPFPPQQCGVISEHTKKMCTR